MAQHYSNPARSNDPHALPDLEVWHQTDPDLGRRADPDDPGDTDEPPDYYFNGAGWYYAYCQPGCLWDGDPLGPFDTEAEALVDARSHLDVGGYEL
jgi:hypothetical protein